jgi:hypothetical protein
MKFLIIGLSYMCLWPAVLGFGLLLFRMKIRHFIPQLFFSCLGVSIIAVILQTTDLIPFLSAILFTSSTLFIWLVFRLSFFHSLLFMIASYIVGLMSEWIVGIVIPSSVVDIVTEQNMYTLLWAQMLLAAVILTYCIILYKFRLGFSFLTRSYNGRRLIFQKSTTLIIATLISCIVVFTTSILFYTKPQLDLILFPLALIGMSMLLRFSYRWELSD